jgi:valyl-tRNA synthetase
LDVVLRMFAPFLPYVTEEVWNLGAESPVSIHTERWPDETVLPEVSDDGTFDAVVSVATQVRRAKSTASVSIRYPVARARIKGPRAQLDVLEPVMADVCATLAIERYDLVGDGSELRVDVVLGDAPSRPQS